MAKKKIVKQSETFKKSKKKSYETTPADVLEFSMKSSMVKPSFNKRTFFEKQLGVFEDIYT